MIRKKSGPVEWLEFELLSEFPHLVHGVFLRHGGVSAAPFNQLNIGGGTGDDPIAIAHNRSLMLDALKLKKIVSGKQTHGVQIVEVPSDDPQLEESCDGLITKSAQVGLLIKHADCQAAIFYDPIRRIIANVHCGWRGNVQNIYSKIVERLGHPEDLLVCISPSLGPDFSEFKNYETEFPASFLPFQKKPTYFDLWEISRAQLEEAGVLAHHIQIANLCTHANSTDYFSYRREKITGRHGTVIALID